jgi:cytochrome c oxidase assembly factor CtaG
MNSYKNNKSNNNNNHSSISLFCENILDSLASVYFVMCLYFYALIIHMYDVMNTNLRGKTRCGVISLAVVVTIALGVVVMAAATTAFAVSDEYKKGWNMACSDDMNMTQFKLTAPHSKGLINGYMDARSSDGPCPY